MALPLPRVVADTGPGGGIVTSMRGQNALAHDMMANAYYPASQEAQIASQTAYAQNLPLQNLATVLSNPNFYAGANKNVVNSLLDRYVQMAQNPPSVQALSGGPRGGGFLSKIIDTISGNGQGGQNALNQMPQQAGGYAQQQPMQQPMQPMQQPMPQNGQPVDMIPAAGQSSMAGVPSSKIERLAAGTGAGDGRYGGINPSSITTSQAKALEATATGEASSQVEQQKKMETESLDAATQAVNQNQLIAKARELHRNIPRWQRGAGGAITPEILLSSDARELNTTLKNIAASVKDQQGLGNAGVAGLKFATDMKTDISMPDNAFNHLLDYSEAMNERISERPAFEQSLFNKGYTPAQVATMWLYYQSEKPFYDAKHHIKDEANLGTWDKFYATPGRRDAAFSPAAAKQIQKVMGKKAGEANQRAEAQPQDEQEPVLPNAANAGAQRLAKNLKLPEFNSAEEFNEYFWRQPKVVQEAIKLHLGGK